MSVPRKPAFDEAAIFVRPNGRQLAVTTGEVDTSDRPFPEPDAEDGGGTRQKITGFSRRSRRNLARWVHSLDREAKSLFLTLTFHKSDPGPREAKESLDRFLECLHGAYPGTSSIWKMEPQERGTPHFHVLVFGVQYIPVKILTKHWHMQTDEASDAHRKSGVDVERGVAADNDKLASYLTKYLGKVIEDVEWEDPGRFWGIRRRDNLPVAQWEKVCTLTRADAERIIFDLLDTWGVELPQYASIPSLTVNTFGDPAKEFPRLP